MTKPIIKQRLDSFVSVVVLIDEGTEDVVDRVEAFAETVAANYRNYELLLLDKGLRADIVASIRELLKRTACIRVLRLARHSSTDSAVLAGVDSAIGDQVVVAALAYDSPQTVLDVVDLLHEGNDVVQGQHLGPLGGNVLTRLGRRAFYAYNRRFLGVDIPSRSTYLTGLSRVAVNALTATRRTHRYLRHLIQFLGYRVQAHHYTMRNPELARRRRRPKWADAIEMISSYSTHPLRVVTMIGLGAGALSLLYGLYVVLTAITQSDVAPGWTTMSLELSTMFFVVTLVLAVQAEYIGRILSESRREAGHFIIETIESDALLSDSERRNISLG